MARRYAIAERAARAGAAGRRGVAGRSVTGAAAAVERTWRAECARARPGLERHDSAGRPGAAARHRAAPGAAAVYLPSCLNRIFGNDRATRRPARRVPEALVALSARAGLPLWIPDDVAGHCCGVPWSSKGYAGGQAEMAARPRRAAALERRRAACRS